MITVPIVAWLPGMTSIGVKSPMEGSVVGFIGTVLLFTILNRLLPALRITIEKQLISGISVLPSAMWSALLLSLLFSIQHAMGFIQIGPEVIQHSMAGFVSTFGSVAITVLIYQVSARFCRICRINIKTAGSMYAVRQFSTLPLAIIAGAYEAIALPVILIWQSADSFQVLVAALTGLAGGILGSSIVVFCYNYFITPRVILLLEKTIRK